MVRSPDWLVFPTTPTEWAVVASSADKQADIKRIVGDGALVSDQSKSRNRLTLSGPYADKVMAKGCAIDLDPRVTKPDLWAQTTFEGIGILLHVKQASAAERNLSIDLYCYAGFAESLWHALMAAGQEFGIVGGKAAVRN